MSAEVPRSSYIWWATVVIKWFVRVLVVGIILLLVNSLLIKADQEKFSSEHWKKSLKRERYVYIEDLIKNQLHVGMTITEVTALLGEPDYRSKDDTYITYVVGGSQGMLSFSAITILDIRFKDGRIERVLTRED